MLKKGIKCFSILIFLLILNGCYTKQSTEQKNYKKISINKIGEREYYNVLRLINDTLQNWQKNKVRSYYEDPNISESIIDSIICFNTTSDRLITSLIGRVFLKPNPTAGITFMLGEKINNKWYFFSGAHIFIPNEINDKKDGSAFEYQQLHQIALKEAYRSYLNEKGEINEAWFTGLFEGGGWGQYPETMEDVNKLTRADYEKRHLEKVADNWYGAKKDTIKTLPINNNPLP